MFNWQDFKKNGEFYVEVTEKNIEDFLSECDKRGWAEIPPYKSKE